MLSAYYIPEPMLFNPLKHHLNFIREYVEHKVCNPENYDKNIFLKEIKHLGTSVMDIYNGSLSIDNISGEVMMFLVSKNITEKEPFAAWAGRNENDFRLITISDDSEWTLKYHHNEKRYVHFFPARNSPHSFRVKSNTLRSAILYYVVIGKDFITGDDLNRARALSGLSPVRDPADAEAILKMIEILRR
jgi:hypothetical protein